MNRTHFSCILLRIKKTTIDRAPQINIRLNRFFFSCFFCLWFLISIKAHFWNSETRYIHTYFCRLTQRQPNSLKWIYMIFCEIVRFKQINLVEKKSFTNSNDRRIFFLFVFETKLFLLIIQIVSLVFFFSKYSC